MWYTYFLMQSIEMGPQAPVEITQPSFIERMYVGITEQLQKYTHVVSNQAQNQIESILSYIDGSPVATSIETLRPQIDEGLRILDTQVVVKNIVANSIIVGFGTLVLAGARELWQENQRRPAIVGGVLGAGVVGLGVLGLRGVGLREQIALIMRANKLKTYYQTEAGQRAAQGKGTGDGESVTGQVDRLIRLMTLGNVPTISGQY